MLVVRLPCDVGLLLLRRSEALHDGVSRPARLDCSDCLQRFYADSTMSGTVKLDKFFLNLSYLLPG